MTTPSDRAPGAKQARRVILTHLKTVAWSVLDHFSLRGELPDRLLAGHANDGVLRVDLTVAPADLVAGDMPRLGPTELERRVWDAVVAETRRDPTKPVKAVFISRLVGSPKPAVLKYCLKFMVERGWLVYHHKQGYGINTAPPPSSA